MAWTSYGSMTKFYILVFGMSGISELPGKGFRYFWSQVLRIYIISSQTILVITETLNLYMMFNDIRYLCTLTETTNDQSKSQYSKIIYQKIVRLAGTESLLNFTQSLNNLKITLVKSSRSHRSLN